MNPIVVRNPGNTYGRSFKGLVRYITDTGPKAEQAANDNDDSRVVFTGSRNLPTENSEKAWKLMAATAMHRDELKRASGAGPGGRQDKGEVMHLVLSWAQHERETLDREQVEYAMDGALKELKLGEHQVYYSFHDEPFSAKDNCPHLHLAINRVHPATGKIHKDWRSDTDLSRWALAYERSRGEVLVKTREENWEARNVGLQLENTKRKSRSEYEAQKAAKGSPEIERRVTQNEQDRAAMVAERSAMRRRKAAYSEKAWQYHKQRLERSQAEARRRQADTQKRIDRGIVQRFKALKEKHREATGRFNDNEESLAGLIANRARYGVRAARTDDGGNRTVAPNLRSFFRAWTEEGYARAQMEATQREEVRRLAQLRKDLHARRERRTREQERREATRLRAEHGERLLRFEKQQSQTHAALEQRRRGIDQERRQLRKLGKSAERAREVLPAEQRPTAQAEKAFGVERSGEQQAEGRGGKAVERDETARPKAEQETSRETKGSGDEGRGRKPRVRRDRKPRKPRQERRAERVRKLAEEKAREPVQEPTNVLPEPGPDTGDKKHDTWRRGGPDGHER